ncbi:MAG: DUF3427 domain-containing protein, partial [Proteobacteria bacterium]|nr:DUF3427 domain-containing protein [Pseudomonadota bacterium]
ELRDELFVSLLEPSDKATFAAMTRELVEFRLAERRTRLRAGRATTFADAPMRLNLAHRGGSPHVALDRKKHPELPKGQAWVRFGETRLLALFDEHVIKAASETAGGVNALPTKLRTWFGPRAGLAEGSHAVHMFRDGGTWAVEPDRILPAELAQVIAFPSVPFYEDLRVACGPAAASDGEPRATRIQLTQPAAPATGTFAVRASGDSMDGGDNPIADNDLVLCRWLEATHSNQVEGRPCLLSGWESDSLSFAQIKVPLRKGGSWILQSWNSDYPDEIVPKGTRLQPIALVERVVREGAQPRIASWYSRDEAVLLLGQKPSAYWRAGHRDFKLGGRPHTVLFVNLRKPPSTTIEHRYADRFESRTRFHWESQASTTPTSKPGRAIIEQPQTGRVIHLFVRYDTKTHKQTAAPFLYCGPARYVRHESTAPIRFQLELDTPIPRSLFRLWSH